jgi:hypothetical protein
LAGAVGSVPFLHSSSVCGRTRAAAYRVAPFRVDVTPPLGHPLLGGDFRRAEKIGDSLFAQGVVLAGDERPIVFCTLDWCELRNQSYAAWREALAAAADTTPERVLVSCVHQHDAPYVDLAAQAILREAGVAQAMCDPEFHRQAVDRVSQAVKQSLAATVPLTHVGRARTRVERIASSRRVLRQDGTPYFGRYSTCRDPALREQPEGEIDPDLISLTFYNGDRAVAALHSYAVHPMSPYGRGIVSADFVGQARARRQQETPDVMQIYATGCSGDVTAGKYNDGSAGVRDQLAERLYDALKRVDGSEERFAVDRLDCRAEPIVLPHRDIPALRADALERTIADESQRFNARAMAALGLSSLRHHAAGHHVDLQVVDFGAAQLALFPAESFVSFQRQLQELLPRKFIIPVGFGECAPGYIPTSSAIREGFREEHGYCWVDDSAERRIVDGMKRLLS